MGLTSVSVEYPNLVDIISQLVHFYLFDRGETHMKSVAKSMVKR